MKKNLFLPCIVLICVFLSFFAYTLPVNNVIDNIRTSTDDFVKYDTYPKIYEQYMGSRLDNWTDALMLLISSYNDDSSVFEQAMASRYYMEKGLNPVQVLEKVYSEGTSELSISEYNRYWHGYNFIVRLLLNFFNYSDIKVINTLIQIALFTAVVILFVKKNIQKYLVPFIVSIYIMSPFTLSLSMQFTWCTYLSLISVILLLKYRQSIKCKLGYFRFFASIGIIINFLDLFSIPLITLGFPLIVLFIAEDIKDYKQGINLLVICCCGWLLGYSFMWLLKWLLASVILGKNAFKSAIEQMIYRSSMSSEKGSVSQNFRHIDVVVRNLSLVCCKPYIIAFIVSVIYSIKNRRNSPLTVGKERFVKPVMFLIIAFMPFVWFFIIGNHSYIHYWFTYRILSVAVFAILCVIMDINLSPVIRSGKVNNI